MKALKKVKIITGKLFNDNKIQNVYLKKFQMSSVKRATY